MTAVGGAAWDGLVLVFSWPNVLYPTVGTLLAMVVALLPGISGVTLMALAIPFTVAWDPLPIMLLFGAFVGGATFMGSITAILLNVPGSAPSAATLLDGYPMARQGRARTAIGCAALASALGSSFGVLVLMLLIPVMRQAILAVGPPELLALTLWGLTTIAVLSRASVIKGLAGAGLGFLFAFVGVDPRTGETRFTFGSAYLVDGLGLVPVLLGLFSVAEIVDLTTGASPTISGKSRLDELSGSLREGMAAVFRHFGLFLRSSVIGTVIGIIPGVGGTVASFVAYGQAMQTARGDRSGFGRGDIRGVLAPEAAHDAKDGGSLVPTLAFGIPGSEGTAMLLAALTLHGLAPGKELMTDHLPLVFVLIWSLFVSNWLTSVVGVALVGPLTRLTVIRTQVLAPVILILAAAGAYVHRNQMEDVYATWLFGLLGYAMKRFGWPRVTLLVAFVLGPLFEQNFHLTVQLHDVGRATLWTRPIALTILGLSAASLLMPWLSGWWSRPARGRP